jgi:hypothetical protein
MDYSASSKGANGLIAVLLITHSRPGPKLVFHHPPVPQYNSPRAAGSDESDSEPESRNRMRGASDFIVRHPEPGTTEISNPLETILGYDVGSLERLLSPGRWCDKFEIRNLFKWRHVCRTTRFRKTRWDLGCAR